MKKTLSKIITMLLVVIMLFGITATTVLAAGEPSGSPGSSGSPTDSGEISTGWCDIKYDKNGITAVLYPDADAILGISKAQLQEVLNLLIDAAKSLVVDDLKQQIKDKLNPPKEPGMDVEEGTNKSNIWTMAIGGYINQEYKNISEESARYVQFLKDIITDSSNAKIGKFIDYACLMLESAVLAGAIDIDDLPSAKTLETELPKIFNDELNKRIETEIAVYADAYLAWLDDENKAMDADIRDLITNQVEAYVVTKVNKYIENFVVDPNGDEVDQMLADYMEKEIYNTVDLWLRNYAAGVETSEDVTNLIEGKLNEWINEIADHYGEAGYVYESPIYANVKNEIDDLVNNELNKYLDNNLQGYIDTYLAGGALDAKIVEEIEKQLHERCPALILDLYWEELAKVKNNPGTSFEAGSLWETVHEKVRAYAVPKLMEEIEAEHPTLSPDQLLEAANEAFDDLAVHELQEYETEALGFINEEIQTFARADWKEIWDSIPEQHATIIAQVKAGIYDSVKASDDFLTEVKTEIRNYWTGDGAATLRKKAVEYFVGLSSNAYRDGLEALIAEAKAPASGYKTLIQEKVQEYIAPEKLIATLRMVIGQLSPEDLDLFKDKVKEQASNKMKETSVRDEVFNKFFGSDEINSKFIDDRIKLEFIPLFIADYNTTVEELKTAPPDQTVDYATFISFIKKVSIGGIAVYEDGYVKTESLRELVKTLPTLEELSTKADTDMKLSYNIGIETTIPTTTSFNVTVRLGGGYDQVRRAATFASRILNDYVQFSFENGKLTLKVTVPEKFAELVIRGLESDRIPETLKQKVFAAMSKNPNDVQALVNSVTFEELLTILDYVDFSKLVDSKYLSRFEQLQGLTNEQIEAKAREYEAYYHKIIKKVNELYNTYAPEQVKTMEIGDFYDGNGVFSYQGTHSVYIESILEKVSNKYAALVASYMDIQQVTLSVDLSVDFEKVGKIEYVVGGTTYREGFLPAGADIAYFAGITVYEGEKIVGWADSEGTLYTEMPDADVTLYPVFKQLPVITPVISPEEINEYYTGESFKLSVSLGDYVPTEGVVIAYQWYKDGVKLEGETGNELYVSEVSDSGEYYCEVTVTFPEEQPVLLTTDTATVLISTEIAVGITPDSVSKPYDAKTEVLEAVFKNYTPILGTSVEYQWYKDGAILAGETNSTLSVINKADSGEYYCVVTITEPGKTAMVITSDSVEVTITNDIPTEIKITGEVNKTYDGEKTKLEVVFKEGYDPHADAEISYQWYKGTSAIIGATNATLELVNVSDSGSYYCVVTLSMDGQTPVSVNTASVEVNITDDIVAAITPNSVNKTYDAEKVELKAAFVGYTPPSEAVITYKWYKGTELLSETSDTLKVFNVSDTGIYYCELTISVEGQEAVIVETSKVNVNIKNDIKATITPDGIIDKVYDAKVVNLKAAFDGYTSPEGATVTYKWYKGTEELSATTDTIQVFNVSDSATYYCVLTISVDGQESVDVTSESITVNIHDDIEAEAPADTSEKVYNGEPITIIAELKDYTVPENAVLYYQWYKLVPVLRASQLSFGPARLANEEWQLVEGATEKELELINVSQSGTYRCEITISVEGHEPVKVNTTPTTVQITSNVSASIPTADIDVVYDGTTRYISANLVDCDPHAGEILYQWYKNGIVIPGATDDTIGVKNHADSGNYYCVITISIPGEELILATSNTVTVAIAKKTINLSEYHWSNSSFVYDGTTKSVYLVNNVNDVLTEGVTYVGNIATLADNYEASIVIDESNYEAIGTAEPCSWTIAKAVYDMSGISFNDGVFTANGAEQGITITGTLPSGVEVVYTTNLFVNPGIYIVKASFTGDENYEPIADMYAKVVINSDSDITVTPENVDKVYDANKGTITAVLNENYILPEGAVLSYQWYKGTEALTGETNSVIEVVNVLDSGAYKCVITITIEGYGTVEKTSAVTDVAITKVQIDFSKYNWVDAEFVYDGEEKSVYLVDADGNKLEFGVIYSGNVAINAGNYEASVALVPDNFEEVGEATALPSLAWSIEKATYDMSDIKFNNAQIPYDGKEHSIYITGTLPEGVIAQYSNNAYTEPGTYTVTVTFTVNENYNEIAPMTATLRILAYLNLHVVKGADGKAIVQITSDPGILEIYKLYTKDVTTQYDYLMNSPMFANGTAGYILTAYDIFYAEGSTEQNLQGNFNVRILIPEHLRSKAASLKVVHIGDNDEVTDMNATVDGEYFVFDTNHFSVYAIIEIGAAPVPEKDIDLTWLWILLAVLAVLIIAAIIVIIILKKRRDNQPEEPIAATPVTEPDTDGDSAIAEPVVEEPVVEEPVVEEPVVEEPVVEEPVVEEPVVEEPVVEEPVVEEPVVEEPVVEEPVVEEPVVEEPVVEAPVVEEPVVEAPVAIPLDPNAPVVGIRYRTSFMSRLIQAEEPLQDYYTEIKNVLLSYKGVKAKSSWNFESFNKGRIQCAKLNIKGNALQVYLGLDPNEYNANKYHFTDVSDKPKLDKVPMLLKVKSDRGLKYAIELIEEMMAKFEIEKVETVYVDYHMPYETTEALAARELVKVILPAGVTADDAANFVKVDVGEMLDIAKANADDDSVVEQTVATEPTVVEEPVTEEPVTEEHVAEEPVAEEPVAEEHICVSVADADKILSDAEAAEKIEIVEKTATTKASSNKLVEINVDTICENFEDGEIVTLEALKEKRLVNKNAGRLKVLARGTMTKKLTVYADKFSLQAVKMITLAGGHADQYK